jgi:hypothetical protein
VSTTLPLPRLILAPPLKISSYGIYSAVFLWRADIFGALNMADERTRVITLVHEFMTALENAASNEYHIGRRYSRLLKSLWFPNVRQTSANARTASVMSNSQTPETSQSTDLESHGYIAETISFDPFCGGFSGFEADILGFFPQDSFSFQGLNSSYL